MAVPPSAGPHATSGAGRVSVLGAVTRPIILFALTLLVLEAAFAVAAARARPEHEFWLLLIDAVALTFLVIVFAVLVRIAPVALMGTEWLREPLAESLAEAVVDGLHGSIGNFSNVEDQVRAWVDLVSMIERQHTQEGLVETQFRQFLTRGILYRALRKMPDLKESIAAELRVARNL
jgi:hypothetical protein